MTPPFFSTDDLNRMEAVYKKLATLPNTEGSFVQIESLYYDLLAIAHSYEGSRFYAELKEIQSGLYKSAQNNTLTVKMKTTAITRFKHAIRQALNTALKSSNSTLA